MARGRLSLVVTLALAVLAPAPVHAQVLDQDCLLLDGYNERCAAWAYEYPEGDPADDECSESASDQAIGPDAVYLTGYRVCFDTGRFVILTIAVGFDGTLRWAREHASEHGHRAYGYGIAVSPDGSRVYVAGSERVGEAYDWVVLAYESASGAEVWASGYDGPAGSDDEAWLVEVSEDGERVYVAGFDRERKPDGTVNTDTAVAAFDAATGERRWVERYDGDPALQDYPRGMRVVGDRVVVTGSILRFLVAQDLQTLVFRDDREEDAGELLWSARYDGGDWDQPAVPCLTREIWLCGLMGDVAVTDDTVAITGTSFVNPYTDDAVWTTIAYDMETGEERWVRTHGDPEHQNKANAVVASSDTVYVTGFENDDLLWDGVGHAVTAAYDIRTGATRWTARQALPAVEDSSGFGVALGSDGEIYVSGAIQLWPLFGFQVQVLTMAYDAATGDRRWVARHNRSGPTGLGDHDAGNWPALTPDGSRLVIGGDYANTFRIHSPQDYRDYGLIAYDLDDPPATL